MSDQNIWNAIKFLASGLGAAGHSDLSGAREMALCAFELVPTPVDNLRRLGCDDPEGCGGACLSDHVDVLKETVRAYGKRLSELEAMALAGGYFGPCRHQVTYIATGQCVRCGETPKAVTQAEPSVPVSELGLAIHESNWTGFTGLKERIKKAIAKAEAEAKQ